MRRNHAHTHKHTHSLIQIIKTQKKTDHPQHPSHSSRRSSLTPKNGTGQSQASLQRRQQRPWTLAIAETTPQRNRRISIIGHVYCLFACVLCLRKVQSTTNNTPKTPDRGREGRAVTRATRTAARPMVFTTVPFAWSSEI